MGAVWGGLHACVTDVPYFNTTYRRVVTYLTKIRGSTLRCVTDGRPSPIPSALPGRRRRLNPDA
eukprot:scaffold69601_cov45-Phaeocystis_antarctica.AAC.1